MPRRIHRTSLPSLRRSTWNVFACVVVPLLFAAVGVTQQTTPPENRAQQNGASTGMAHAPIKDSLSRPITAGGFVDNGPVVFSDITHAAGLDKFHHVSGTREKATILETPGSGVALLDYDNDGWLDIYLVNGSTFAALNGKEAPPRAMLFHNNHDGTFTDVTAKAGVADGRWSTGAAFGDYDGDGFLDLMVANYVEFDLAHPPAFGKGVNCKYKGIDVQCGPRGLKGSGDSLFHNNGDGTFTDVSKVAGVQDPGGYYGLGVVWADFNNTGKPDIYVANDSTPSFLYRNAGKGKFEEIGLESGTALSEDGNEQASMGIAIGDYLHNGRPSIYVTHFADDYDTLYRNDGKWEFRDVSYAAGVALPSIRWVKWGDAFADLDNDTWLDLIVASGHVYPQVDTLPSGDRYREPKLLDMNQGNGTFCDAHDQAGPALQEARASRGLAVGDLFNDGNVDVVVENLDGAPTILKNPGVPGRHWISLELQGTKSNRLAIGARVKLVAGGVTQTEEIHSGGSYLSQNDLRVHFGLAAAAKVDSVEIHWPSGAIETIKDLSSDKFYSVLEGKGVVPFEEIRPKAAKPTPQP